MPRSVSARLTTLCGCSRYLSVPAPAPQIYELPIMQRMKLEPDGVNFSPPEFKARTFRLTRLNPPDAPVEADYVEVPE